MMRYYSGASAEVCALIVRDKLAAPPIHIIIPRT